MAEQNGCCAVIVAAGNSTRMGRPKQFLPLLGKPALWWTLRAFDRAARVSSLVLVVREEDLPQAEVLARRAGLSKPFAFAPGGAERQALVDQLQELLAQERPFIPLWFGRTLHAQSPTVDNIDYPSSSFSNENVWEWTLK